MATQLVAQCKMNNLPQPGTRITGIHLVVPKLCLKLRGEHFHAWQTLREEMIKISDTSKDIEIKEH